MNLRFKSDFRQAEVLTLNKKMKRALLKLIPIGELTALTL